MPTRVRICTHEQVVLVLVDLDARVEVSALEQTVEDELLVFGDGGVHAFEDAGRFGLEVGVEFAEISCHLEVVAVDNA
jgi:hypothetical protein